MTKIKIMCDEIKEELCGAKNYAEKYIEYKSKNNMQIANRFKEMSNDELKHAMYIHDLVTAEVEELSKVYTPPEEMLEKWDKDHKKYVEKSAWVKQMLSM